MRTFAIAAVAALLATSASAGSVSSTIASIDAESRILHLSDRTSMTMGHAVDMTGLVPGMQVEIFATVDEDGFAPATGVVARQ